MAMMRSATPKQLQGGKKGVQGGKKILHMHGDVTGAVEGSAAEEQMDRRHNVKEDSPEDKALDSHMGVKPRGKPARNLRGR